MVGELPPEDSRPGAEEGEIYEKIAIVRERQEESGFPHLLPAGTGAHGRMRHAFVKSVPDPGPEDDGR